jgi:hypothetical protein
MAARTRSNKPYGGYLKRRRASVRTTVKIISPEKFIFLEEYGRHALFAFLDEVDETLRGGKRVVIDFSKTIELHPCGTIIFMARLDGWIEAFPGQLTCTYPTDEVVEQLLQHVEVLSRLGLSARKKVDHDQVRYWHHHSGTNTDSATYKELTKSVRDGIIHPNKELFADCLNEAVVNTVNHAYKFISNRKLPKTQQKWWMFSLLKDDQLFVAIYDRGIGIPDSLRRKPEWTEYLRMRQYKDARLIEAAVSSKLTSTRLPHRGKGLPEMLEFSQNLKAGGFSIWSRKGGVSYNPLLGVEHRRKLPVPLTGTLVLWSIPFQKEHKHANNDDLSY